MIENTLLGNKSIIRSEYLNEDILCLADRTFVFPPEFEYSVVDVTDKFIARMDLISQQMYGTVAYSDFLCKINGISNPFELNDGDRLIVPKIMELHKFAGTEDLYEDSALDKRSKNHLNTVPQAKKKTEKRAPNEAIIGDKRYKIDSVKKIIVY